MIGLLQPTLKRRLVALAMLTSSVALALAVVAFSAYEYSVVRAETRRDLEAQAGIVAANVAAAAAFDDADHARRIIQSIESRPQFGAACLFNESGRIVASYARGPDARLFEKPAVPPPGVQTHGSMLAVWAPVVYEEQRVGTLYMESQSQPLATRYREYIALSAVVLSVSWLIALWLAWRLQRSVSGPILDLVRTARRITEKRDYGVRARKASEDEIGQLADGLNDMLSEIQARDQALQSAHDGLERRVAERTRELQDEVAERRRVEAALADETERLSVTLRSIGDGVITTDARGRIALLNRAAEQATGLAADRAIGRPLGEVVQLLDVTTRQRREDPVAEMLRLRAPTDLGEWILGGGPDGADRIVACSGAPIQDPSAKALGVVLVLRDVTDRHHATQKLLQASKLESIGVLAGGIAHDFNNILTVIIGNVSLARSYAARDGAQATALEAAERASTRAADLTRRLLTFAKGGAPVRKTASLSELIHETAEFVLHGSKVACHFAMADELWHADVDTGQISQVLHNLLLNAAQAMPDGGLIEIKAWNVRIDDSSKLPLRPGPYVAVSIHDSGPGIAPEHMDRIFEPYFTTKKAGSGLGLATSYSIVRRHDGHIDVESPPGRGTTFRLHLPATLAPVEGKPVTTTALAGRGRILVMDDDPSILRVAVDMLARLGYEADTAPDGSVAIEMYRHALEDGHPFTAVIVDLTVPGGQGGQDTIGPLKQLDPNAKVLVSSGYADDPVMARYDAYGFSGVVAKPYSIEVLSIVLHDVLSPPQP